MSTTTRYQSSTRAHATGSPVYRGVTRQARSHRSPIPAVIALTLASWLGVAYVMPAADTFRQVGQVLDGQQTDTYTQEEK